MTVNNKLRVINAYRLVPWAWCLAWVLTGVGGAISDIYSLPSRSLVAYYALSAIGWLGAGAVTASASRGKTVVAIQWAAWFMAYLVAIPLGLAWLRGHDMPAYLLYLPMALAGFIGGIASSSRRGSWRFISAVLVGLVFFVFFTLGFYGGYFLSLIYFQHPIIDLGYYNNLVTALPEGVFGLLAGFVMRWILGIKQARVPSDQLGD